MMSKEKKIRLKEMSHKKLRKLCKKLGEELNIANAAKGNALRDLVVIKNREISWKAQFDAEVYYKKQVQEKASKLSVELTKAEDEIGELKSYARSLEKTVASEARRIQEKNEKIEEKNKRIEELELALDAFGNRSMPIGKLTPFIGELPEDVSMSIDGQLMTEEEEAEKHAAWVAREVARAMQENYDNVHEEQVEGDCIGHSESERVDMIGSIFGVPTSGKIVPTALNTEQIVTPVSQEQINKKMDEAVEWAKRNNKFGTDVLTVGDMAETMTEQEKEAAEWAIRNGHHQPEGNPEPNKMDSVRIKSADEISAENIDKHTEMVCNDIAKDKSRFL